MIIPPTKVPVTVKNNKSTPKTMILSGKTINYYTDIIYPIKYTSIYSPYIYYIYISNVILNQFACVMAK